MKKIGILTAVMLSLTITSCKKNWTCTCTDATGGEVKKFTKITKRQALSNCQTKTVTEDNDSETETCTLTK